MKKVTFLLNSHFNRRDFKRFGIELLGKNGFDVEAWDLTNILLGKAAGDYSPPDPIDWAGCKTFNTKSEVLAKLKSVGPDTFIISIISYNLNTYAIYKAISASGALYAFCLTNIAGVKEDNKRLRKVMHNLKRLRRITLKKLLNRTFLKVPFKLIGIKPATLIIGGGKESVGQNVSIPTDSSTEILWTHAMDYDLYLDEKTGLDAKEKPIAVFLDEILPSHPDYDRFGAKAPISADKYYPLLNNFFKLVENSLGLNVVIDAHSRSHYKKKSDFFEERQCVSGKTVSLVREAKVILAHASTSLNFANLFNKPVIFLTSTEIDQSWYGGFIRTKSKWFGKKPIFIDRSDSIDLTRETDPDEHSYSSYRSAYIKKQGSPELPLWQIVSNRLTTGFDGR